MTGRWGSATMVVMAGAVMALGAGIWRQSIQAKAAPAPVPAAAPNSPPPAAAPNSPPPAPAPSAAGGPATPGTPSAGATAEFQALVESFSQKVKTATDRRLFAEQLVTSMQQFIQRHPKDAVADQARLMLGKVQLTLQQPAAAVETFRQIADHPTDPRLASPARFYLAQAFVASGQVEAARQTLTELSKSAESEKIRQAARSVLAQMKGQQEAGEAVAVGKTPPAIEATDLSGQPQSLDRYRGKVLLIDFWATWCGPCRAELPNVKALYRKYKDRGFAVLGVSLDEDRSALKGVLREEQMEWPQLCDGKGWRSPIAQQYGVTAIPRTVLLDRQGVIRYVDVRGDALDQGVAELLGPPAR
jgi:peroxiredoxin/TolA-binding protein